jgi:nucleoside-diphosphate-sugar epimerase
MKIFLTGASGFIGNRLALKLAAEGNQVHALVRRKPAGMQPNSRITYFQGDITQPETIDEAMKHCEQVYHVAAYAKLWAPKRAVFYDVNVTGTENVLNAAVKQGVAKMVYTSSCAVFGPSLKHPITEADPRITAYDHDYDLSKFIAEGITKEYCKKGLSTVIVSPSRVYGPGLETHTNAITEMLKKCLEGKTVFMPGIPDVVGNYVFIDDVVDGHVKAMNKGLSGERYIIGGENLSYRQVIEIIRQEIKIASLMPLPAPAMKAWGYIQLIKNKLTGQEPIFTPDAVSRYLQNAAFDSHKAKDQLDYKITNFREGIRKTISFLTPTR